MFGAQGILAIQDFSHLKAKDDESTEICTPICQLILRSNKFKISHNALTTFQGAIRNTFSRKPDELVN